MTDTTAPTVPEVVPTDAEVAASATATIWHQCPFVDETDRGTVTIGWTCYGSTIELHSLAAYLKTFTDRRISHEDLVAEIADTLRGCSPDISGITVTGRFSTAGLTVEITNVVPRDAI